MNTLKICLFGQPQVCRGERLLGRFPTRKAQHLFGYLVLHRQRFQSREALASLFWGEAPEGKARKCLRTTLWRLRSFLETEQNSTEACLLIESNEICFNRHSDYWLDVEEFENCLAGLRTWDAVSSEKQHLGPESFIALTRAVELYQGDLLEGCYEDWSLYDRERLQGMLLVTLEKLMAHYRSERKYEQALSYGQRILSYDPLLEAVHREMMRLHCLAGNRGAALRQYRTCQAILAKELGIEPMEETTTLYAQICRNEIPQGEGQAGQGQASLPRSGISPRPTPTLTDTRRPLAAHMDEALHQMQLAQEEFQRLDTRFRRTVAELKHIRREVDEAE